MESLLTIITAILNFITTVLAAFGIEIDLTLPSLSL